MAGNFRQCSGKFKKKVDINHDIKVFTEDEIRRMTRDYSIPIGKGGFGEVFRGLLDDNHDLVAVKRYIRSDLRKEFMEEVSIHSQMNHKNVVKLIGYCIEDTTLTMVSEYIPRGNLDAILHKIGYSISLNIILGIAIGCAEALSYMHSMHTSRENLVCHGDIKPANILLDGNLTAKVSDFGLSRLLPGGISQYTSLVQGSLDYMDPMYLQSGRLTPRSDVYSFGIVLLELVTRRSVMKIKFHLNLIDTFRKNDIEKWSMFRELVDADIASESNMMPLLEIWKMAMECMTLDIYKRPKMNVVAVRLRNLWHTARSGYDIGSFGNTAGTFNRNSLNSKMLEKLGNVRMFTMAELRQVTQNWSSKFQNYPNTVYKGRLEDNTGVVVYLPKFGQLRKEVVMNTWMLLHQTVHKNIIKLVGCCLEADNPVFVYECPAKCSLYDILNSGEDFPLHMRLKIAAETAEVLEYIHLSAMGITAHDSIEPRNLLVDDNFMPMLTSFSWVWRVAKKTELPANDRQIDNDVYELSRAQRDVYEFGLLLLTLIRRKKRYGEENLDIITQFTNAYEVHNSGRVMFHKDITDEGDIAVFENIGRLALKCVASKAEERPRIAEVARRLRMLRTHCMVSTAHGGIQISAFHPKASFAFHHNDPNDR